MIIEVLPYDNYLRKIGQTWSQGLYEWRSARTVSFGNLKAGIFQRDFVFESPAPELKDVVAYYVAHMKLSPSHYPVGKYNVRIVVDFDTVLSVTIKVS